MDDNNSLIDEEVQSMCETNGATYFRSWTIGRGMPARFVVHMQHDSHPSSLRKSSVNSFSLVVMNVHPVLGIHELGNAIVESKAVDGFGELAKLQDHR